MIIRLTDKDCPSRSFLYSLYLFSLYPLRTCFGCLSDLSPIARHGFNCRRSHGAMRAPAPLGTFHNTQVMILSSWRTGILFWVRNSGARFIRVFHRLIFHRLMIAEVEYKSVIWQAVYIGIPFQRFRGFVSVSMIRTRPTVCAPRIWAHCSANDWKISVIQSRTVF